jgi:hypothetical protein
MRDVLAVAVTFAFCALMVMTAIWVINRWERRGGSVPDHDAVQHRKGK